LANLSTGDFDAVLQVSGSTINRLMATLHQNAGTKTDGTRKKLPGHPRVVSMRIGPDDSEEGVRGWLNAQLGVPRVSLLDRVTDRFELAVDVRARFFAEDGSAYLPKYIHGVVNATYRIHPIDPSCPGWKKHAADYFWPRVLKDTVRFRGTTDDDGDSGIAFDEAEVNARIERLVAQLLHHRFEAAALRVERRFRPGRMRSLKSGTGDAVAVPVSLSGGDPSGQISSIEQVFLAGHDFAVALSVDWLMEQVQPYLERVRIPLEYTVTIETNVGPFTGWDEPIRVSIRVTELTVLWEADDDSWGWIRISAKGEVVNDHEVVLRFTLDDRLTVDFDASAESLRVLHRGSPAVNVTNVPGLVDLFVSKGDIESRLRNAVNGYLTNLPSVSLGSYKDELVRLLKTLDDRANTQLVSARFGAADVVLFGRVSLTPRNPPVVQFEKSDDNSGFVAFASWAPGGWIERFTWEWQFYRRTEDDSRTLRDRYVLSRPPVSYSRWGKPILADGDKPLAGLDGWGWMCLDIQGFQIDSVTGQRVPFRQKTCTRYGYPLCVLGFDRASRLLGTLRWAASVEDQPRDIGLIELGGAPVDRAAANSMVFYSAGGFDREAANILAAGLDASAREDAGLMILALVREEAALEGGADLAAEIAEFSNRIGAHFEVVEDVARSWTRRLAIPPDVTAWRLITPNGGFTWSHNGQITPEELARALNAHLRPSPSPYLRPIRAGVESATYVPPIAIGDNRLNRTCPRARFVSPTHTSAGVIFAKAGSRPSELQLAIAARMWRQHSENAQDLVVVLDGDEKQTDQLAHNYPEFELISDPDGDIANRFGIRIWPTIVAVDGGGIVTGVRQGLYEFHEPAPVSDQEDRSVVDSPASNGDAS
jgi:hypothetical protein